MPVLFKERRSENRFSVQKFFRVLFWIGLTGALIEFAVLLALLYFRSQPVELPQPTGEYAVGRTAFAWEDELRVDPLVPGGNPRELLVWVWYPAERAENAEPAEYLPEKWLLAREKRLSTSAFMLQDPATVRSHAVQDASPAAEPQRFPVLIFAPGYGSIAPDYTALAEDLASRGYIVAGVTPTGSASVVVFPDGREVTQTADGSIYGGRGEEGRQALKRSAGRLVRVWAEDMRFVLDQLAVLNAAPGPFHDRIDVERAGFFGHSFGGATSAEVCRTDGRCKAGADLDGTLFGDVLVTGLNRPFFFMWSHAEGREDIIAARQIYDQLPEGSCWTEMDGLGHLNYHDIAAQFALVHHLSGALGDLDGREGLNVIRDSLALFFDYHLKDSGIGPCQSDLDL